MSARLTLLSVLAAALFFPAAVHAKVPIYSLSPGESSSAAGAHADIVTGVEVGTPFATEPPELPCVCNTLSALKIETPPGLIAAPTNLAQCTEVEFATHSCPVDSQVGLQVIRFSPDSQGGFYFFAPLYNMQAREDEVALLATPQPLTGEPIYIGVTARTESDYGLEFTSFGIPAALPPNLLTTVFWGVPGDPVHDALRFPFSEEKALSCGNLSGYNPLPLLLANEFPSGHCVGEYPPVQANSPLVPFTQNPTACLGAQTYAVETLAHDLGTDYAETSFPATTGCDQLGFEPSLAAKPTTTEADSPSGLDVDLQAPQTLSPSAPTPSAIRDVTVTLPPGFSVDSNAADGKTACTQAEGSFGTREQAHCPEYAKIGTAGVISSNLPGELTGAMYLGEPLPGERYRVFLVFDGFSLHVKLAGTISLDRATGQVISSFDNLPQFNFQEFKLHFFGAERGLLATPTQCGTYPVRSEFTPWAYPSIPKQTSTQFFTIDSGPGGAPCPPPQRPFDPTVSAGVTDNTGGAHSTFAFAVAREDGDQNLSAVQVKTPPGFSAVLAGIPYCPDASLAALSQGSYLGATELGSAICPASVVGSASASAGAGSRPVSLPGKVYLAGPYEGAPLSLAIVTPAVSGPYDLGNVVVRAAVHVDPETAQVTAISDPLPQILEGIPLRLRRVTVVLDRPDFIVNPTDCDPLSVDTSVSGDEGALASSSAHFQVANCADLPYRPRLGLRLSGGLNRLGHPAIHAVFNAAEGEANTHRVEVTLPPGELLDQGHIGSVCTRVDFANHRCAAGSAVGSAEVATPLLDQPLSGKVYLRSSSQGLPDLAIDLSGQVDFELVGQVDSVRQRYRTIFKAVPDVPVSSFRLDLFGGGKGLLQNSEGLCGTHKQAVARLLGQNGVHRNSKVPLELACGGRQKRHRRHGAPGHTAEGGG